MPYQYRISGGEGIVNQRVFTDESALVDSLTTIADRNQMLLRDLNVHVYKDLEGIGRTYVGVISASAVVETGSVTEHV